MLGDMPATIVAGCHLESIRGVMDLKLPLFGLYGACSTIGEALMLGAMMTFAPRARAVDTEE